MRKLILVLVFICSLIAAIPLHAQQGKGAALLNEARPATGQVHGLIIGINQYQDFPALQYANADALNFYRLLLSPSIGADSSHVVLLLNEKASSPNVYEALENLVTFAKPGDRVFIYFSGHGDVEKTTVQQFGFLVTYDTPKKMVMRNSLDVNHLNAYVNTLSLKNKADVFLITDACRSGRINESQNIDYSYLAQTLGGKTADEVRILSSQSNQLSYEGAQWGQGRGLFSYVLTNGIAGNADADGDSIVTLYELSLYLMQEVPKMAKPNKQTPIVMGPLDMPVSTRSNFTNTKSSEVLVAMADLGGKGYEDLYLDSLTSSQRNDYDSLLACIAANKLQKPSGKSARDYYEKLRASSLPEPFSLLITRKLIAALQKQGQEVLHKLVVEDELTNRSYKLDWEIAANLKYSAELLGKDHYLYKPTLAKYYYFLSYAYYSNNDYQEDDSLMNLAIITIDKALAIDSTVDEFYRVKALYLGMVDRDQESLAAKLKALSLAPGKASLHSTLGLEYATQKDFEKARKHLDTAATLDPSNFHTYSNLAYLCLLEKNYDEGLKWIDKTLAQDSSFPLFWHTKGELLCGKKEFDKALLCYDKAIALDPQNKEHYHEKGFALYTYMQDYKQALLYMDSALLLAPEDELILQGKTIVLWFMGDAENGLQTANKALRAPNRKHPQLTYDLMGNLYALQGKADEALQAYDTVMVLDPAYSTNQEKAQVLLYKRKFDEALICINKYLEVKPNAPDAYLTLSNIYFGLKQFDKGFAAFKKAVQLGAETTANDFYNQGCAYSLINNLKQAIMHLEKAIQLGWKDFEWIDKDTDWNNIRETPEFKALIKKYRK